MVLLKEPKAVIISSNPELREKVRKMADVIGVLEADIERILERVIVEHKTTASNMQQKFLEISKAVRSDYLNDPPMPAKPEKGHFRKQFGDTGKRLDRRFK